MVLRRSHHRPLMQILFGSLLERFIEPSTVAYALGSGGTLLSELVERPTDAPALLDAASSMLLAPFRPGAPLGESSIFAEGMGLSEKIKVYGATLERRISSAKEPATKEALRTLRDYTLESARELEASLSQDT